MVYLGTMSALGNVIFLWFLFKTQNEMEKKKEKDEKKTIIKIK